MSKRTKKTNCSFCNQCRVCVKSPISEDVICVKCLQDCLEVSDELPMGAVACLKCKKYSKIKVTMDNNVIVEYSGEVKDSTGAVCYMPVYFKGEYKKVDRKSASCMHCNTDIPLYLLDRAVHLL